MGNDHQKGSSSSRKGKKNSSDNKQKPPQRGLGVAQLEKIRLQLHGQIPVGYPSLHAPYPTPNFNQEDRRVVQVQAPYASIPSSTFAYPSFVPEVSFSPYGYHHPSTMMGFGEYDRTNIGYGDSQSYITSRSWNLGSGNLDPHLAAAKPRTTHHFLDLPCEDSQQKKSKKQWSGDSMGSTSQNSESFDSQELDLELRLSI